MVGPDLEGVTERRDRAWLARWIAEPDKMLAEGDPIATQLLQEFNNVPMINSQLSPTQVEDVLAYLENPGGPVSVTAVVLPEGGSRPWRSPIYRRDDPGERRPALHKLSLYNRRRPFGRRHIGT
ncbi:MAG: cytochrome c [Chloroflexi bacterium]|nr:cytochrome c [Chloroflexota bacterium]